MPYSKCIKCIHGGKICQQVMAYAVMLCSNLEIAIWNAQTRQTQHKCLLKIDYSCENFVLREKEEKKE